MKRNFPCECGHTFKAHEPEDEWLLAFCKPCQRIHKKGLDCKLVRGVHYNWVHEFTPDNLGYLERLSD